VPYSDRWGITATKVSAGVFDVRGPDGRVVRVAVDQTFPDDLINAASALFLAIKALYPSLPDPWRLRYQYAFARWKLSAYGASIPGVPAQQRPKWQAKSDKWVAEEARLKAIMGTDA
jgi:hypothetical protein